MNKVGPAVGGIDLINYSELYHPMSHHHVACGDDKAHSMPSELFQAQNKAKLVQNGFYDKEALELDGGYQKARGPNYVLRPYDHRLKDN